MTAKIYKITNGDQDPYIGNTILKRGLARRLTYHRQSKKKWGRNEERYMASFPLLDGNEKIELLEECDPAERKVREQFWIDTIPNCNINNATGRKDRKEYLAKWREDNKETTHNNYLAKYKEGMIFKAKIKREFVGFLRDFNI
jgi:hypothetical protein